MSKIIIRGSRWKALTFSICFFALGVWASYDAWNVGIAHNRLDFVLGILIGGVGLVLTLLFVSSKYEFTGETKEHDADPEQYHIYAYSYTGVSVRHSGQQLFTWAQVEKIICRPYEDGWGDMDLNVTVFYTNGQKIKIMDSEVWHFSEYAKRYIKGFDPNAFSKAFEHYRQLGFEEARWKLILPVLIKEFVLYEKS